MKRRNWSVLFYFLSIWQIVKLRGSLERGKYILKSGKNPNEKAKLAGFILFFIDLAKLFS